MIEFRDRRDAGDRLAAALAPRRWAQPHLLAVPSGGVAVAVPMAEKLGWPLSLLVVRKIQLPWNTEAGFGALTAEGEVVLNETMVKGIGLSEAQISIQIGKTAEQIEARRRRFAHALPPEDMTGQTGVIVDDGLASGMTMLAAVRSARHLGCERVVVAVPVAHDTALGLVAREADEVVALVVDRGIPFAVASFYEQWWDLTEDEVLALLSELEHSRGRGAAGAGGVGGP